MGDAVSEAELIQADAWYGEALSLRDEDPEQAISLMAQALEVRIRRHGDSALECAHTYMFYGQMLFEQAQASTDILGDQVQKAAKKRDASGMPGAGDDDDDDDAADSSDDADDDAGAPTAAAAAAGPSDAGAGPSGSGAAADGEDASGCGGDDMQLAFEMLEVARVVFEKHGGAEAYPSEMADIFLYLGDHCAEREEFPEAVAEYEKAAAALARMQPEPRRRLAEVFFKKALALQFGDELEQALTAITTARATLRAHVEELERASLAAAGAPGKAAAGPAAGKGGAFAKGAAGGGVREAAAAGASALSTALAAFAAPAPTEARERADEPEGEEGEGGGERLKQQQEVARARREAEEVRAVLEEMAEKADELRCLIAERASMKSMLAGALRSLGDLTGGGPQGAAAVGGAQGAAAAAPVQDLGVVGRGRRLAPAAAGGGASASAAAGSGTVAAGSVARLQKRSLTDLMGGAGTTVGFGAASKSNVQPQPRPGTGGPGAGEAAAAAKRPRQEAVGGAAAAAAAVAAAAPAPAEQCADAAGDENEKK